MFFSRRVVVAAATTTPNDVSAASQQPQRIAQRGCCKTGCAPGLSMQFCGVASPRGYQAVVLLSDVLESLDLYDFVGCCG